MKLNQSQLIALLTTLLCAALRIQASHAQTVCGPNICAAGTPCCNPSCGICGEACTQQYCGPVYSWACFSAKSTVDVLGKSPTTSIADLQVGDRVLTASGKYQKVYAFGHYDTETMATFRRITFVTNDNDDTTGESSRHLEVSDKHLIHVNKRDQSRATLQSFVMAGYSPVPAEQVRVGDFLQTQTGKEGRVVQVDIVERKGRYAPFTTDGTIAVDGVVASSYVELDDSLMLSHLPFVGTDTISHLALSPFRLYCTKVSPKACQSYNEDGIPHVPAMMLQFFQFLSSTCWLWVYGLIAGLYLGVAAVAFMTECVLSLTGLLAVLVVAYASGIMRPSAGSKVAA